MSVATTRDRRSAELAAGTVFSGFRIERVLGRGGMAIVYLAREMRLDRLVCLKVISSEIAEDERFRARFRMESRTAASIEHPHVVTVFRAGEHDRLLYVAMRYIPGLDLQRLITAQGPLGPERATALISQVAAGLDAVHMSGLVHRDVKPANVIVAEGGDDGAGATAYLTDFGLAKAVASTERLTAVGEVIGTVDYMAPEQIRAERVDARTDVYALGCVLFHALTGRVPFPERESSAKMWAQLNEPPPPVGGLDSVIRRAMAKDPALRFPSAGDLGRAALAAVHGEPVTQPERTVGSGEAAAAETRQLPTERQPAATERLPRRRPRPRRHRRGWRVARAATLLVLIGLGAAAFIEPPGLGDGGEGGAAPDEVTVPNVVGESLDVAERELEDAGFRSDRLGGGAFGVVVPANWDVCEASPGPGSTARPGSTVDLLVGRPEVC